MNTSAWLFAAASPTPLPDTSQIVEAPAWIGFAVTAFVAIVSVLLIMDMNRRIRRSRYREEVRQQLADEEARKSNLKSSGQKPSTKKTTSSRSKPKGSASKDAKS